MSSTIMAGGYAGIAAGVVIVLCSHLAPFLGAGDFIHDMDQPHVFGKTITRREAHVIGLLVHLLFSFVCGLVFAWGVTKGWVSGFHLLPVLGWACMCLLFQGGIMMPLEGHGFFGVKHDSWFPIDVLLTNIAWGFLYLLFLPLWISV